MAQSLTMHQRNYDIQSDFDYLAKFTGFILSKDDTVWQTKLIISFDQFIISRASSNCFREVSTSPCTMIL